MWRGGLGWKPGHREVATAIVKVIKDGSSDRVVAVEEREVFRL